MYLSIHPSIHISACVYTYIHIDGLMNAYACVDCLLIYLPLSAILSIRLPKVAWGDRQFRNADADYLKLLKASDIRLQDSFIR